MAEYKSPPNNQYDRFVTSCIILLATGTVSIDFINYYFIIGLVCIPLMLYGIKTISCTHKIAPIVLFMLIWFLYAYISVIWTPFGRYTMREIWNFSWCIIIFVSIFYAIKLCNNPKKSILNGWCWLILITLCVALWEVITDSHIPQFGDFNAVNQGGVATLSHRIYAAVTYKNLNSYSTLLCMALPILCYGVFNMPQKIPFTIAIFGASIMLIINASRASLLALIIDLIILIFFYRRLQIKNKKIITLFLIISITVIICVFGAFIVRTAIARFVYYGADNIFAESKGGRYELWLCGLKACIDSMGFGQGVGSFYTYYKEAGFHICYPHNLVIEFVMQYGIWLFIPFGWLLFNSWRTLIRNKDNYTNKMFGWMLLCSFIPTVVIDDTYLIHPYVWLWLCTQFSLANILQEEHE